ncbi:hypothetical protein AB7M37_004558 [Sinorhizobium fredii]
MTLEHSLADGRIEPVRASDKPLVSFAFMI